MFPERREGRRGVPNQDLGKRRHIRNVYDLGELARGQECPADSRTLREGHGAWKATAHGMVAELCLVVLIVGGKSQYVNTHVAICNFPPHLKACENQV